MKKVFFSIVLALFFSSFLFGQDEQFDFFIDPVKTNEPTEYDTQNGNWAAKFHETYQERQWILEKATKRIVIFVYGTASQFDNGFLENVAKNEFGADFTGEGTWGDVNGHETLVAGCIGGYSPIFPLGTGEALAKKGLLWLIPVRTIKENGGGRHEWTDEGMQYGIKKGKEFQALGYGVGHSISSGGTTEYKPLTNTIEKARANNQFVIISAGNTGVEPILHPSAAKMARAIGAVDQQGERAYFSSIGRLFISAGGVNIMSTKAGGGLGTSSGTSFSCPLVSGIFAVFMSCNPNATVNQVERFIARNATPGQWNKNLGFGVIKISLFKDSTPMDEVDTPLNDYGEQIGDTPDVLREYRELYFDVKGKEMLWKPSAGTFKTIKVISMKIKVGSELYDNVIYDRLMKEVDWYFTRRALVLNNEHGFIDAGEWTMIFGEMLINRQPTKLNIKIMSIDVEDEAGRTATVYRKNFAPRFSATLNRLQWDAPTTLTYFNFN